MNRIDWTHLGGLPFTQDRMKFLQDSQLSAFSAIAKLCGDKTILYGIVLLSGNVSSGWFSYNGELIEFVGGSAGAKVKITETPIAFTYANASVNNVQYIKTATCGPLGDFDFAELVPLITLKNIWKKDDVRMVYKDNVYIGQNFDSQGYGFTPEERGWRIINEAIPDTGGRVFVSWQSDDADYDIAGKKGGSKTNAITRANLPAEGLDVPIPQNQTSSTDGGGGSTPRLAIGIDNFEGSAGPTLKTVNMGNGTPLGVRDPFFVMLYLIKL